ncbi:hypothetical protein B4N89_34580 [Embleya scabrispora]|uniref:Uncharacterized protein n=1 Tax=Embleya scabrispora TaxID=159449 RepID=A0A1T3NQN1_9ACTN|nr:hypothetical protein B4N89_34580 [Embleya scabrispora]
MEPRTLAAAHHRLGPAPHRPPATASATPAGNTRPPRKGRPGNTTRPAPLPPRCQPVFGEQRAHLAGAPGAWSPERWRRPITDSDQPRTGHPQSQARRAPRAPDPLDKAGRGTRPDPPPCSPLPAGFR